MTKNAFPRGKFIDVFCGQRFSLWQVSRSDGKRSALHGARPIGRKEEKKMITNEMNRFKQKNRMSPPAVDTIESIAAYVEDWPPGEIMDWDVKKLKRVADELNDNIDW